MFQIEIGIDPAVNFMPMQVTFKGQKTPLKALQRTYLPEQVYFLPKNWRRFHRVEYIYRSITSKLASTSFILAE